MNDLESNSEVNNGQKKIEDAVDPIASQTAPATKTDSEPAVETKDPAGKARPEEFLEDEEFLEKNVYANKRICEEIIDRYIVSLKNGRPPRVLSSGGNGASKIKTPTTLKEAKLLADIMFLSND